MIEPNRAVVRPRVVVPGRESLPLEDEVRARLDERKSGLIELIGSPGSGKSTALAHLKSLFADVPWLLLADQPDLDEFWRLKKAASTHVVIYTSADSGAAHGKRTWRLCGWTRDECIEYLLAVHPAQCKSVMRRIQSTADRQAVGGNAELWRIVLDRLAADDSLIDARAALRQELAAHLATIEARAHARQFAFHCLLPLPRLAEGSGSEGTLNSGKAVPAPFLLRHIPIQLLLAAEHLADQLNSVDFPKLLAPPLPEELVAETGLILRGNAQAETRLRALLSNDSLAQQSMTTSVLHAMGADWPPDCFHPTELNGAYLSGLRWPGVTLTQLNLAGAELTDADLSGAQLFGLAANGAQLSGATFRHARLNGMSAQAAALVRADFSSALAFGADFSDADLRNAKFDDAELIGALLIGADLSGGSFCGCNLTRAELDCARLAGADFTNAEFSRAKLGGLSLQSATFTGAHFGWAQLQGCNLEGLSIAKADFRGAQLQGAHLTGSQMPGVSFRWADLRNCGLAEVEWEGADLRSADLRGSSFHLGSSRSGLVGSPIACEGSRTGFYTDEFHEQGFKSPEEIRKANLRGADLRGAKIENVDFYLVDLRNALYTREQERHLRDCKAILQTRACGG